MTFKFRNSILGFNKEDVLAFVLNAKENEKNLTQSNEKLKEDLENKINENDAISKELAAITEKFRSVLDELNDFKSREESLTKLSESIGKLYLVAKANAKNVISSAEENAYTSGNITKKNIELAESTDIAFDEIRDILSEKTKSFIDEVNDLKAKLEIAKERINANNTQINQNLNEAKILVDTIDLSVKI